MNTAIVKQQAQPCKTPWQLGFEDASVGNSIWFGYHMFLGDRLVEYKRGWFEGQSVVDASYVPFQMPKEVYSAVQFAEDRADWIGE